MSRPTDWSPVYWASDPVPGDPEAIATAARSYGDTAYAINESIANLDRIDRGGMQGKAITAVLDKIKTVRGQLDGVESRVEGAAQALSGYHPVLAASQAASLRALQDAEAAQVRKRQLTDSMNALAQRHNSSNDPEERETTRQEYVNKKNDLSTTNGQIDDARRRIQKAIEDRNEAADNASGYLKQIDQQSPVHDSVIDKIVDWAAKASEWIEKNLKPWLDKLQTILDIASWVLTIAAVLATLTGIGAAAAPFLLAAAKACSLVSTVITGFNTVGVGLLKALSGKQSWGSYLGSVAMFGGVMVAKKFLGPEIADGTYGKLTKAALGKKDTLVRQVARWACNHEVSIDPLVQKISASKAASYVEKGAEAVKKGGEWMYENVIKPVTQPQRVPQQYYRRQVCGGVAGSGGW